MNECIFCELVAGNASTHKIYEDERTFAFLDKHPINEGHILVVPKRHVADFYKLDTADYQALMETVRMLAQKVAKKIGPKKVGLIVAGWDVPHMYIHAS